MLLRLRFVPTSGPSSTFSCAGPSCYIGLDPSCEVSLPALGADGVAWRHARIDLTPEGAWLVDLQSSTGTFCSGVRVNGKTPLHVGDQVRLGEAGTRLDVTELDLPAAGIAAPPSSGPLPEWIAEPVPPGPSRAPNLQPSQPMSSGAASALAATPSWANAPPPATGKLALTLAVLSVVTCALLAVLVFRQERALRNLAKQAQGLVDKNQELSNQTADLSERMGQANQPNQELAKQTAELSQKISQLLDGAGNHPPLTDNPLEKPPTTKPPATEPPPPSPRPTRVPVGKPAAAAQGAPALLWQVHADEKQWRRVRPQSAVHSGDPLVSLPGSRSEVMLDSGVRVQLWGELDELASDVPLLESKVVFHEPTPGVDVDLTLVQGRVIVANHKPKGEALVRVRLRNYTWDAQLPDTKSAIAVERRSDYLFGAPIGAADASAPEPLTLLSFFTKGEAKLKIWKEVPPLPNAESLVCHYLTEAAAAEQWPALTELWAGKEAQRPPALPKALEELDGYLDKSGAGLETALIKSWQTAPKSVAMHMLCVFSLGAVDALPQLLDVLEDPRRADLRKVAVLALRHWLGGEKHETELFRYLKERKEFSDAQARLFLQLLHGYGGMDRDRPETFMTLIPLLQDARLPIRQLAAFQLAHLAPEQFAKVSYDPAGTAAERAQAVKQWQQLIPPGSKPPPEKPK